MTDGETGSDRLEESQDWLLQVYRATFEQARDAILIQDFEGVLYCNAALFALLRVPDEADCQTLTIINTSAPYQDDGQPVSEAATAKLEQVLSHGKAFFEWRSRTWDGVEFPSEVHLSRIDVGNRPLVMAVVRDISERKALEETSRRQKAELEEAQRIGRLGNWVWDITAGTLSWSDEIYRIFGVAPQSFEATYDAFLDFVHPDDRALVDGCVQRALAGEIRYDIEHRIRTPAGAERTVHERAEVERNAAGEPIRMVGTVQDVTQQAELERGLKRLVAILNNTPDYVALHDAHGTVRYLNAAARRYLGLPAPSGGEQWRAMVDWEEAELPAHMSDLQATHQWVHPDWAADKVRIEGIPSAVETGSWQGETALLRSDGQETPMSQVLLVHRDDGGNVAEYSTIMRDISERKAAEAELRRRAEGEAMVQAISTDLLAAPYNQIDATIEDALARIGQAVEANRSYLFQLADDGRTMSNTHEWTGEGVTPQIQDLQGLATADFDWLLDRLRRDEVLPIRSLAAIPDPGLRDHLAQQGIRSLLLIPMVREEGLIGFLGLDAVASEPEWSESEQHLLRIAADTLAGALARQRMETELRYQARHDPLTGLLNRRPFEEALGQEVHRAQRYDQTFALIMLDIDHFKAINDTYGHDLGDRILEELAEEVSDRLREADLLARWGGEEFMALLPETDARGAHQVAAAIQHRVAEQDFPGVGHLTVSLGVVESRAHEAIKDVTRRVDEALYAAKEGGRNRVVVDGEAPTN